jgi:hypothetical protein
LFCVVSHFKVKFKNVQRMEKDLMKELAVWEENDEYDKIIQTIKQIPNSDLSFELKKIIARAYNHTMQYNKALKILLTDEVNGREDMFWNYSVGYAYYYKRDFEMAVLYFHRSAQLGDEAAKSYESWCLNEIWNKKWYKITLNSVEIISKNNGNWDAISSEEQQIVALYLLEIDMKNGGFLTFFCNWGYICYLNAISGLVNIGCKKQANIIKKQFQIIQHLETDYYEFKLQQLPKLLNNIEIVNLEKLDERYLKDHQKVTERVFKFFGDYIKNYNQNNDLKKRKIDVKILNLDLNTKH